MSHFYVVGGRQKAGSDVYSKDEWHQYGAGMIVSVDTETGVVEPVLEYVSPPEVCAAGDDPSILFKTATLKGSRFYVPTQTEVLVYEVPSFRQVGYVTLPSFNDVHHVTPAANGNLFVANTGLDMVQEIEPSGAVVREWSTAGEELWTRFSKDVDYRKVVTTKPHKSHPNHVCFIDGDAWVSRCDSRDLFCLTSDRPPVAVADRWIHDGLVRGDSIYFTAVNGQVIIVDRPTMTVRRTVDLNRLAGRDDESDAPLGWCRGIEVLDDDRVAVGLSRLRPTKWKEKVRWVKHKLGGSGIGMMPTRIAIFNLRTDELEQEVNLEPVGMNVVFSIHDQARAAH